MRADVAATLDWFPAELNAGDAVCIDGLAPHYSEANDTDAARRVLIASYAPERERYDRARYYRERASACGATPSATAGFASARSPTSRAPRSRRDHDRSLHPSCDSVSRARAGYPGASEGSVLLPREAT